MEQTPNLIRPQAAAQLFGMSTKTLARIANRDSSFPGPIRIGSRMVLFDRAALVAYFNSKRTLRQAPMKESDHAPT